MIGNKAAQILHATSNKLTVKVPLDATVGGAVKVSSGGIEVSSPPAMTLVLNSAPTMNRVSNAWLPPGYKFSVSGVNFGSNPDKVQLYIGPCPCQVISVTPNAVTGITPADYNGYTWGYYKPIK